MISNNFAIYCSPKLWLVITDSKLRRVEPWWRWRRRIYFGISHFWPPNRVVGKVPELLAAAAKVIVCKSWGEIWTSFGPVLDWRQYWHFCNSAKVSYFWGYFFSLAKKCKTWVSTYYVLEIKPCRLGSRIQDMEAESYNWSHFLVND